MRIAIAGWGVEGQSAYRFFGPTHSYLIVNEHPRDDFPKESDSVKLQFLPSQRPPGLTGNVQDLSYLDGVDSCDLVIYSVVGYKNLQKKFGGDSALWAKAKSVQHVFFETTKSKNIIGVTGTKGKGTTSTLIAKMLEADNKIVYLGGNIGRSVLDFAREVKTDDWVVLELSNFQLYSLPHSPHIGVCLMITAEHLDWHPDIDEYLTAKANLFKHQKSDDIAIYFAKDENSKKIAGHSPGKKIPYFEAPGAWVREDSMIVVGENEITPATQVKLIGEHNLQNICAAVTAAVEAGCSLDAIKRVLHSFSGLEHRLELVRSLGGINYYDDSFATTPESAIVALRAFKQPKVVILGGSDKGLPFGALASEIAKANVRQAIVIGQTAEKIAELLTQRGFSNITLDLSSMPEIVNGARNAAKPGDVVLLSTGCASFGMFKDYKDRGEQFQAAVKALV